MPTFEVSSIPGKQLIVPMKFTHGSALPPMPPTDHQFIEGSALIDTGASHTAIREDIPVQLGLLPIGKVLVNTPSSTNVTCNQYLARLIFPNNMIVDNIRVTAMSSAQSIHCLIGMDILSHGVLVYDGPNKSFSLTF